MAPIRFLREADSFGDDWLVGFAHVCILTIYAGPSISTVTDPYADCQPVAESVETEG